MSTRQHYPVWLLLLALVLMPYSGHGQIVPARVHAHADEDRVYFPATGHWLEGVFLKYWRERGGLPIFGYPLTPAFWEQGYSVQYFERARMEHHPEWARSPYEVSLGQLGRERLRAEGRGEPRSGGQMQEGRYFPETGFDVRGPFLHYWERWGGLQQFGYPLTPEVAEKSGGLTVQYFERARMEMHPEYAGTKHHVLLTLLGTERAASLDPTLRTRWSDKPPDTQLQVEAASAEVPTLKPVTLRSSTDRKSTRLNSSHLVISYAVFCLKKKKNKLNTLQIRKKKKERTRKATQTNRKAEEKQTNKTTTSNRRS